jgi:putative ABC transport system ATP-binding protein
MEQADVLQISGLRQRWPGLARDLLQIDSLGLAAGQRLLVQGDSGSGKSTLLSLAAGVLLPTEGQVSLLGQSWRDLPAGRREQWRADHVGYLFQQLNLLPYLSVLDNVLLPCRFSRRRAERCGRPQEQARELLRALDLAPALWPLQAARLSVGQQQRVAAARALIGQPELVIADEPTSALDERRRDGFMQLLLEQCERSGCALLFVTHDSRLASHFQHMVHLPEPAGGGR